MTEGNPVSIRIPAAVLGPLDALASALDRSRSWVIVHALGSYLAEHGQGILAAAKGAAELERGDSEDFDDVLHSLEAIIAAAEASRT